MNFVTRSFKRSFFHSNLWVGLGNALLVSKGIILLPLLIKNLGTNSYGALTLLLSTITLLLNVSNLGTGYRYKRFMPSLERTDDKRNSFYNQFFVQAIVIGAIAVFLFLNDNILTDTLLKKSIKFTPFLVTILLFCTFLNYQIGGYFRLTNRMKLFTLTQAGVPYLEIVLFIIAMIFGIPFSVDFILIVNIVSIVVVCLPMIFMLIHELGFGLPSMTWKELWNDAKFGFPMLISLLVDFFLATSDRYIINYYLSPYEVGLYSPAYSLGSFIRFVPSIYIYVMPVYLAKLIDNGLEDEAKRMIDWSMKIFFVISIPFVSGGLLFGKPVLEIFANNDIAQASSMILPIVSLATVFYGINVIIGEILFLRLKTKRILLANGIAAVVNIILNIILIPIFRDITVAAITTLIGYITAFIAMKREIRHSSILTFDMKFILKVTFISLFAGGAVYGFSYLIPFEGITLVSAVILYAAILCGMLFRLEVISKREIEIIKDILFYKKNETLGLNK